MKNLLCLILTLVLCVSFVCPVLATEADSDFVPSPGTQPSGCTHGSGYDVVNVKDPSCSQDGYTGDHICPDCGQVIAYGEIIPKTPHKYVDGVCVYCHEVEGAPETGDHNILGVWLVIMAVAAAGLVVVTCVYRKKFAFR